MEIDVGDMLEYLKPLEKSSKEATIFRSTDKQKFICTDYAKFCNSSAKCLFGYNKNYNLLNEWTKTLYHSIIFDIDVKPATDNTTDLLKKYFYNQFLKVLRNYVKVNSITIILAMRRDRSGGLHVHLADYAIAHDDYVHLCSLMKKQCSFSENGVTIELGCPSTMCLVGSAKPNLSGDAVYVPVTIINCYLNICCSKDVTDYDPDTKRIIPQQSMEECLTIASLMMPFTDKKSKVLYFETKIERDNSLPNFKSYANDFTYSIYKNNQLLIDYKPNIKGSFGYQFFKNQSDSIEPFSFSNGAWKTWYKKFKTQFSDTGMFRFIISKLRNQCIHLRYEENPLKNILMTHENVLPVFFALCNEVKGKNVDDLFHALVELYEPVKEILQNASENGKYPQPPFKLTFQTILYCAFKSASRIVTSDMFYKSIGMGWKWIFETVTHQNHILEFLKFVQERYYPLAIIKYYYAPHFTTYKKLIYTWDPRREEWQQVDEKKWKLEIYSCMERFEGFDDINRDILNVYFYNHFVTFAIKLVEEQFEKDTIKFNELPSSHEFKKKYGRNVPEYHFIEKN